MIVRLNSNKLIVLAGASLLLMSGCASNATKDSNAQGAKLSKAEVADYVTGNTEVWDKAGGGAHYNSDGTLKGRWEGKEVDGTWLVKDDGRLCMTASVWGNQEDCHSYVDDNGVIKLVYNDKMSVREMLPGNQLDTL